MELVMDKDQEESVEMYTMVELLVGGARVKL